MTTPNENQDAVGQSLSADGLGKRNNKLHEILSRVLVAWMENDDPNERRALVDSAQAILAENIIYMSDENVMELNDIDV